jgi:hypothetical protein
MNLWRYIAIPRNAAGVGGTQSGELAGATAAEVRAALRRIGLQVIELKRVRTSHKAPSEGSMTVAIHSRWQQHLRSRRTILKAELFDSIATILNAGLPLLETLQTLIDTGTRSKRSSMHSMLVDMREQLRSGQSLPRQCRAMLGGSMAWRSPWFRQASTQATWLACFQQWRSDRANQASCRTGLSIARALGRGGSIDVPELAHAARTRKNSQ